ncbi:MAG: T9SS type A sorting domain-containing protein [Bacteroidetes bacterium]|nr:T9SS type A sorting domain-containing protein [Bacteroidota bacterium]
MKKLKSDKTQRHPAGAARPAGWWVHYFVTCRMKIFALLIFFLTPAIGFSQGVNNLWIMGYQSWVGAPFGGTNMDFTGGNLNISFQNRIMYFEETNGEICDRNGNFLFSSNGVFIANAQNDTMVNGSGLNPAYFTNQTPHDSFGLSIPQANLIIPIPDDSMKYYLFHETSDDYGNTYCALYLYFSVIDMALDSGRGEVTQKNVVLLSDSLVDGKLMACKHANGRDWWLITHRNLSTRYFKFLITPYGIQGPYIQDIGVIKNCYLGQCVFSPDGSKFAYYEPAFGDLDIMDFDRCSGNFNNLIHIDINDSAILGGVAFCANSKVLYVSSMNYVYQFDVSSTNVPSTQTTIAIYDGFYSPQPPLASTFFLSQLAPDGKIYINCGNGTLDMHVIDFPDSLGLGCNLCQHCIHLQSFNSFTIPNHPNYFLGAENGSLCDTVLLANSSDLFNGSSLHVFPNPVTRGDLTFTYNVLHEPAIIIINDIDGKEIVQYRLPQWSSVQHVKLPALSGGIYLARLLGNHTSANVKFLVE